MPTTLLTGANSFVGAHVINALIAAGHKITGTVRREGVAESILALHPEWKDHLEIITVADLADEKSWDTVFKDRSIDHIVHVAAPLLDNPANTDYDRDFLKPSVDGNLAILKSAHAHLPSLKSIVFTGSVNAVSTGFPSELSKGPLTNSTWLPLTPTAAREANDPYLSYCSGKKEGELAIWSFLESSSPSFSVTVLLPAIIIAPPIQASSIQNINYSAILIYNLMNKANEKIPPTTFPSYIDGRDLADAHVKALTAPGARNKRFLVGGMDMTFTELVRALKKVPELEGRVPAESGEDKNVVKADIDAKEGNETLEMTFRSLEETMRDIGLKLLALEKA